MAQPGKPQSAHIHLKIIGLLALVAALLALLTLFAPYTISTGDRQNWLEVHRAQYLGETEAGSAVLSDAYADGRLEVQLWQVTADGEDYRQVVAWQQGIGGGWRVVYSDWFPLALLDQGGAPLTFGFRCGLHWYSFAVSALDDSLLQPSKTFRIF